ncbi:hemerythrin domain-containing protein [Sphaerisporangium sp. NPDC088356]|uniref:hemerythrin domain-containing protein n=1 Tax=Sphaerisporangium sp. NPDC088356 TaxID=3154871 RepID=UPI00341F1E54
MTTATNTSRRRRGEPAPDLVTFLAFHAGLRRDFLRLADAVDRCPPGDTLRRALIDEHTAFMLRGLHHHHTCEDNDIWPLLRGLVPEARPVLDRLEADHQEMDAVVERLAIAGRPARKQADDLRRFDGMLKAHLDLEESEVVPLIAEHVSAAWWEKSSKVSTRGHGRDLPMIVAWTVDAAGPEAREHIFRTGPLVLRLFYRLSWRHAYEHRAAQVFG